MLEFSRLKLLRCNFVDTGGISINWTSRSDGLTEIVELINKILYSSHINKFMEKNVYQVISISINFLCYTHEHYFCIFVLQIANSIADASDAELLTAIPAAQSSIKLQI